MKELVISLILAKGQLMHIDIFDISCHDWYDKNVIVREYKIRLPNRNLYYHKYKGKHVFGYVCGKH